VGVGTATGFRLRPTDHAGWLGTRLEVETDEWSLVFDHG
jgi:hypothetical protein